MTTTKDKLYFNFDGVNSEEFGIASVELGTGLYEETMVSARAINETQPKKRHQSIFHGITKDNRVFELNLAFENGFNKEKINDIINWLFKDYYKPLYFEGQEDRVVFAIMSGDSNIIHNGVNQGYFTVTVQTNSPYRFSQVIERGSTTTGESWSDNPSSNRIDSMVLKNEGHIPVYPEFSIRKIGNGDLTIKVDGRSVLIVNLTDGENIFIDSMRGKIITDVPGQYRYENIRAGELEDLFLDIGDKEYIITGDAEISCRYREAYEF